MAHEQQQFLSPEEFGQILNLKPRKIYSLIKTRKIVAVRFGRVYRINREEISRFLMEAK